MSEKPPYPMVSIIIPCRNDGSTLAEVLSALQRQHYAGEGVEIIVVDNGSSDNSKSVALAHGVILLEEETPSAYVARNQAIQLARGAYLLFLDADTIPCAIWVEEMVKAASAGATGMAGGRIDNRVDRDTLGSALLALTHDPEKRRASVERDGRLSGGNMIVKRELFDRYGLFLALQSGADGEFSTRTNPDKKPMPYANRAVVHHVCDISSLDYLRRAFREARGQALAAGDGRVIRPAWPWRPGLRRACEVKDQLIAEYGVKPGRGLFWRLFIVLWLERWFFYCGALAGRMGRS